MATSDGRHSAPLARWLPGGGLSLSLVVLLAAVACEAMLTGATSRVAGIALPFNPDVNARNYGCEVSKRSHPVLNPATHAPVGEQIFCPIVQAEVVSIR